MNGPLGQPDNFIGILDYRDPDEVPKRCSRCGGAMNVGEMQGEVYVDQGDLAHGWPAKWGATREGRYRTISLTWMCENYDEETKNWDHDWGPILYG